MTKGTVPNSLKSKRLTIEAQSFENIQRAFKANKLATQLK